MPNWLAYLLSLLFGKPNPPPPPVPSDGTLLGEINKARVAHGVKPVVADTCLCGQSMVWALTMASGIGLSHEGDVVRAAHCGIYDWGEIVANASSPADAVQMWLSSPTHRWIMLNGRYTVLGAGSSGRFRSVMFGNTAIKGSVKAYRQLPSHADPRRAT